MVTLVGRQALKDAFKISQRKFQKIHGRKAQRGYAMKYQGYGRLAQTESSKIERSIDLAYRLLANIGVHMQMHEEILQIQ